MNIKIYSKKNCQACDQAKALLDAKGLGYEAVDVMLSKEAQALFREKGFRSVPQIVVDGTYLTGGVVELKGILEQQEWMNMPAVGKEIID